MAEGAGFDFATDQSGSRMIFCMTGAVGRWLIFRIELDRLIVVADGAVVVALGGVPEPAAVESYSHFSDRAGSPDPSRRWRGHSHLWQSTKPRGCGRRDRIFRIELDRLIAVGSVLGRSRPC